MMHDSNPGNEEARVEVLPVLIRPQCKVKRL